MESEKVKEIKEKLQEEIFIANSFGDKLRKVPTKELQNLLTLINELERENKTFLESKTTWKRLHTELCKENQQLKDRIAELENENKILRKHNIGYHVANNYEAQEQLKEFVERLKEKAKEIVTGENVDVLVELLRFSDELVKEFSNENGKF